MSVTTLPPVAQGADDDFSDWEAELAADRPVYRPTRAAQRRADREACDRGMGYNRHRRTERREV